MAYLYQRQVATWSSVVTRDCSIKKQKKTSLIFEKGFPVLRNCLRKFYIVAVSAHLALNLVSLLLVPTRLMGKCLVILLSGPCTLACK